MTPLELLNKVKESVSQLTGGTSGAVSSVNGRTGAVVLTKIDVGLGSVNNTSDAAKPISNATAAALATKAPIESPALTGTPTTTTPALNDDSERIANTAFVQDEIADNTSGLSPKLNDSGAGETLIVDSDSGEIKKLVAGANITLTPGADSIEIASSGGGGGGADSQNFKVRRAAAQSVANNTPAAISFDNEDWDTDSLWDAGTPTRITFTSATAGKWGFLCRVGYEANSTGTRYAYLYKNGSAVDGAQLPNNGAGVTCFVPFAMAVEVEDGDYIELFAYQDSGGSLNCTGTLAGFNLAIGGGGSSTGARVARSTNQSINTGSATVVTWETEDYDTDDYFDAGANDRFTAPEDGTYIVELNITFASNSTGERHIDIKQNGTAFAGQRANALSSNAHIVSVSAIMRLSAGDFVQAEVFQTSGGALNVLAVGRTHFSIAKLS